MEENNVEEVVQPTEETPTDVTLPEVPTAAAQPAPNSQEVNLRELRAAKAKAEKEREELAARLAQYEQQQQQQMHQQQPPEQEADIGSLRDDDLIEAKHLKEIQKQLQSFKQQQTEATDETRLKSRYGDFEKVVNEETINALKAADPEFAETIALSRSSLYSRGSSTYKRIKELGLYVEDSHVKQKETAQANASKPRPSNSVSPQAGDSPLSMANAFSNGLTDDLKKQLWKEMQEASKRS